MTSTRDSFIARDVGYAGLCDFSQYSVAIVVSGFFSFLAIVSCVLTVNFNCEQNLLKIAMV